MWLFVLQWQLKNFLVASDFPLRVWELHVFSSVSLRSLSLSPFLPIILCLACESVVQHEQLVMGHSVSNEHTEELF
jgi:hypothetical protein